MTTRKSEAPDISLLSFSEELLELQELVKGLEKDELSLEDSLKHYEAGVKIVSRAKLLLDKAEQEVHMLEVSIRPVAPSGEEDEHTT
jgi:exodeoxyribonuclease VII small subunit